MQFHLAEPNNTVDGKPRFMEPDDTNSGDMNTNTGDTQNPVEFVADSISIWANTVRLLNVERTTHRVLLDFTEVFIEAFAVQE